MSRNFGRIVKRIGFNAAVRQARNLGISFEDCYQMAFGREVREAHRNQDECDAEDE